MKRLGVVALILATAAVGYATVGDRIVQSGVFGWFSPSRRLPSLKTQELPFRYPANLWRAGIEGEVLLKVHITQLGEVDSVRLERSSGVPRLDSIAMNGAHQLKYHPATQGETAVAVWANLPVRFQRSSPPATEETSQ